MTNGRIRALAEEASACIANCNLRHEEDILKYLHPFLVSIVEEVVTSRAPTKVRRPRKK